MVISHEITDREHARFRQTQAGNTAVAVLLEDAARGAGPSNADTIRAILASEQVSLESSVNSSVTPLGSSGAFTGTFEDVSKYSDLTLMAFADQASATNGLSFQWSSDGVNADRIEPTNLLASTGRAFRFSVRGKYFRVVYTNGAVAQSVFRLKTTYHVSGPGVITKRLDASVTEQNFAQLVQAPVMARLEDGTFQNIAGIRLDSTALIAVADATAVFGNQGSAFKVSSNRLSTGVTSEVPYMLLRNPAGSGKIIRLDKMIFIPPEANGTGITFRVYTGPTVTAVGTLLTAVGNRQSAQDAAVGLFYTLPTVSANGSRSFFVSVSDTSPPFVYDTESGTLIEPGFDMLITADQTNNTGGGGINLEYSETTA